MTDQTTQRTPGSDGSGQGMHFKVARIYMRVSTDAQDLARQEAIVSTAKKAGYYMCNARARFINTVSGIAFGLGKNGENFAAIGPDAGANSVYAIGGSIVVYCNGTTDYIDLRLYASSVQDFTVGAFDTYLEVIGPF